MNMISRHTSRLTMWHRPWLYQESGVARLPWASKIKTDLIETFLTLEVVLFWMVMLLVASVYGLILAILDRTNSSKRRFSNAAISKVKRNSQRLGCGSDVENRSSNRGRTPASNSSHNRGLTLKPAVAVSATRSLRLV